MATRRWFVGLVVFVCSLISGSLQAAPPADGWVIWQSNRKDSRTEIYRARADGSEVTRLTTTASYMPAWAPDGRWIAYRDDSSSILLMRPDGSNVHTLTAGDHRFWMHDNSGLVVQIGNSYYLFDPETAEQTLLYSVEDFPIFGTANFQLNAMTHDNRYALVGSNLYQSGFTGANGSITSPSGYSAVVVDLLHRDKVYYLGSGCWPFTPPAGDLVFHICADCPTHPDIYHMHLADLMTRSSYSAEVAHADPDWGHEYNPRVSNDNRWISYMASAGCHEGDDCNYDIWLHELGTAPSERYRVTEDPSFDGYPQIFIGPLWQPSAGPRLLVAPNRVTFYASASSLPAARTLKIKNIGAGTLGPATVDIESLPSWLHVEQTDSGISVGLVGTAITQGTHCANIVVTVDGATNSPFTVPITVVADETFPAGEAGVVDGITDGGYTSLDGTPGNGGVPADARVADACPGNQADAPTPPASSADADAVAKSDKGGGCSCRLASNPGSTPLALVLGAAAFLLRRSRRGTR